MVDPLRVLEIVNEIGQLPDASARSQRLGQLCGSNDSLRIAVERELARAAPSPSAAASEPPTVDHQFTPPNLVKTSDFARPQPNTWLTERYKLLEPIGEGGMGVVWLAEQREPVRRKVAVKLIKAGLDSQSVLARFEAERQALALMDHPHIARVYDGGVTPSGSPFFVMEYVAGIPVNDYCDVRKLPLAKRLELFVQICQAVQHAHHKGIVHRDLKPSNVLITEQESQPLPKIIDFGVAKALHAAQALTDLTLHTAHGAVIGTPLYMAPEQMGVNALDVDTRSDVYSLGVLLYELLTGTTPLEKRRLKEAAWDEVCRIVREDEPPRPSTRLLKSAELADIAAVRGMEPKRLRSFVSGDLDWIVMKALEKDRNARYDSPSHFSRDIQRFLADEPVEATPPSWAYRAKKFIRRHRGAVLATSAIGGALLLGLIGLLWGLVAARIAQYQLTLALGREQAASRAATSAAVREGRAREAAQQTSELLRRSLSRQYVANGSSALEQGESPLSLLWFVKALELDQADALRSERHRRRIANTLRRMPDPAGLIFHDAPVTDVAFSPQGDLAITCGYDGAAHLVRLTPQVEIVRTIRLASPVLAAAFSPNGLQVATGSADGMARVWDARTAEPASPPLWHRSSVSDLSFSPAGERLAAVVGHPWQWRVPPPGAKTPATVARPEAPLAAIWNWREGKATPLETVGSEECFCLAYSRDGKRLATGGADRYSLLVVDAESGQRAAKPLRLKHAAMHVALSSDGSFAAVSDFLGNGSLWSVERGELIGEWPHSRAVAFAPEGQAVFVAGLRDLSGNLQQASPGLCIDLRFGEELEVLERKPASRRMTRLTLGDDPANGDCLLGVGNIETAVWSPDGQWMAAACWENVARFWRRNAPLGGGQRVQMEGEITAAQYSSDGQFIAASDASGVLRFWRSAGLEPLGQPIRHGAPISDIALTPDDARVATAGRDGKIKVWSCAKGEPIGAEVAVGRPLIQCLISPTGENIYVCADSGTSILHGYRLANGAPLWDAVALRDRADIALSPDGAWLGGTNDLGEVMLVRTATGERISAAAKHGYASHSPSFARDSSRLATCGSDAAICFWNPSTANRILTIDCSGPVGFPAGFSPDGLRFAGVTMAGELRIWNVETGAVDSPALRLPSAAAWHAFSPDGGSILLGLKKGEARLLDAFTLEPLGPTWRLSAPVSIVRFHPSGDKVLFACEDGSLQQQDVRSDPRSLADLIRLANLHAGGEIDDTGSVVELNADRLRALRDQN